MNSSAFNPTKIPHTEITFPAILGELRRHPGGRDALFGLYASKLAGVVLPGMLDPVTGLIPGADKPEAEPGGPYDLYECLLDSRLSEFDGRLVIDWGRAHRSWGQVAANQDKEIIELRREVSETPFPGYLKFIASLSEIATLPTGWQVALRSIRGIYLLTCPKTKEQYVGKASGSQGFWGRWLEYFQTGHGGNLGLKSRDPSDYQISILEVCGSALSERDIDALESLWKMKLQSREMGLNRN